jgi:large conductance mechanosensitive channel
VLKGFREFISRGNVVDLAVGVIMGVAFSGIVSSLVGDVITPIIGAIFGRPDFSGIGLGPIMIGKFINAIVNFLLVSLGVYFFIVLPMNLLMRKKREVPPPPPEVNPQEKLLTEIRDLLARK